VYDGNEINCVRTILCVDDHTTALLGISRLLESGGYRCLTAATPEEAMRLLQENVVDLAVVDYWLPPTTGVELAHKLRTIRRVPIILFTGDPGIQHAPEGVDLLLGKPQTPEDLLGFVAALLPNDDSGS
jgi:CheY-like chemotaxis protein